MSITSLRSAILLAGAQPAYFTHVDLLKQLITVWGGTPTQASINGLLKEAITVAGGGQTTHTSQLDLLKDLVTALGGNPASFIRDELWALLAVLPFSGGGGGASAALMEGTGYILMEDGSKILIESGGSLPINSVLPAITASSGLLSGQNAVCSTGTWLNSPTGYAYQWFANGAAVGTNSNTLAMTDAMIGTSLTCRVTATNGAGSVNAVAAAVGPVGADTIPNQFTFTDLTGVGVAQALQTSNAVTISGLSAGVSVTAVLTGDATSEIQKNAGVWSTGPISVQNGDTITVRHTSGTGNSQTVNSTVTINGITDTFSSTTVASGGIVDPILSNRPTGWAAGQNPPQWTGQYSGPVWDASTSSGGKVRARWRQANYLANAWQTEADQVFDSNFILGDSSRWPALQAHGAFPAGGQFDVEEQFAIFTNGVETSTSNWAGTAANVPWTDNLNAITGVAFQPSSVQPTRNPSGSGGSRTWSNQTLRAGRIYAFTTAEGGGSSCNGFSFAMVPSAGGTAIGFTKLTSIAANATLGGPIDVWVSNSVIPADADYNMTVTYSSGTPSNWYLMHGTVTGATTTTLFDTSLLSPFAAYSSPFTAADLLDIDTAATPAGVGIIYSFEWGAGSLTPSAGVTQVASANDGGNTRRLFTTVSDVTFAPTGSNRNIAFIGISVK